VKTSKRLTLSNFSKGLMIIGAAWIIIFSILYMNEIISYNFYGWRGDSLYLIILGVICILVPFSVKTGIWEKLWAVLIGGFSALIIMGIFIGHNVDYKAVLTYINVLPHMIIIAGAILLFLKRN